MNYKRLWSKEALAAWYAESSLYVCARKTVSVRGGRVRRVCSCPCHSLIYATAAMALVNFFNKMPKRKHHKNK